MLRKDVTNIPNAKGDQPCFGKLDCSSGCRQLQWPLWYGPPTLPRLSTAGVGTVAEAMAEVDSAAEAAEVRPATSPGVRIPADSLEPSMPFGAAARLQRVSPAWLIPCRATVGCLGPPPILEPFAAVT
jgi:hypothetical protein